MTVDRAAVESPEAPAAEGEARSPSGSWYACYTRARHEKRVEARLAERGFVVYLPLVVRVRQWHDREKRVPMPMFPGYLFVRFRKGELHEVLSTPGVSTIISFNGAPVPISDAEIENVRRFAEALSETGTEPEPAPLVEEGQAVRVVSGPFREVEGHVIERRGGGRVLLQVGLKTVGQGLKVEVEEGRLEPLEEGLEEEPD